MNTINVSLPAQLKIQAEALVVQGYYASFSDVVRTALRNLITTSQYDVLANQAKQEHKQGKTKVLQDVDDITAYLEKASQA